MHYFAENYFKARELFRKAARGIGAQLQHFKCPDSGPTGEPLYTDTALIGNKSSKRLIIITSGTHGVEGFAGSSIQTAILSEVPGTSIPLDTAVLMIHAVNPYGFSHLRRFNEDNIDINRNFVDHPYAFPANENHYKVADILAPTFLSSFSTRCVYFSLMLFLLSKGFNTMATAVAGGQNIHAKGLYYGGTSACWSNRTTSQIIKSHGETADTIILLDFHTGLGGKGRTTILINHQQPQAWRRALNWWGQFNIPDTSKGVFFSKLDGSLSSRLYSMFPSQEVTAATVEFGTEGLWRRLKLNALIALQAENWLHHHGHMNSEQAFRIKNRLKEAFAPVDDDQWKVAVRDQGREIFKRVLVGITDKS